MQSILGVVSVSCWLLCFTCRELAAPSGVARVHVDALAVCGCNSHLLGIVLHACLYTHACSVPHSNVADKRYSQGNSMLHSVIGSKLMCFANHVEGWV